MTYEQTRGLQEIIKHYGVNPQMDMAIEECSELIKALLKFRRNSNNSAWEAVIDELADVEIMISQMKIIFDCSGEVESRIDFKIKRQIERMKENE